MHEIHIYFYLFSFAEISTMIFKSYWPLTLVLLECVCYSTSTSIPKEVLDEVETNLLSLFGFRRRPRIDRSKVVIPEAMLRMYEKQIGHPYDTASIPRPGLHTMSANTVRSYTHIGRCFLYRTFSLAKKLVIWLYSVCPYKNYELIIWITSDNILITCTYVPIIRLRGTYRHII